MKFEERITLLKSFYQIHEEITAPSDLACGRKCAACCTCNVACTTLEGWLVYQRLAGDGRSGQIPDLLATAPSNRFRPAITTNQMVELCMHGHDLPEEVNDPSAGVCPCLELDLCSLYDARPFGCRAMLSTRDCAQSGEASMPPFVLSLNHVMLQYLEAVDRPGGWGNLIDVLAFLADDGRRRAYENQAGLGLPSPLLGNRPFPVLMIPPEHRDAMQPILLRIQAAIRHADRH